MIDERTIDSIKQRARIEEVVADYVPLRRRGARFVCLCPFHDDRHLGNFSVYPAKNVFRCFACGAHGGPVDFVMHHLNLSFHDAIRWLGRKYNILTYMEDINFTPVPQRPVPEPLTMLTLPMELVTAREHLDDDVLARWINLIKWDPLARSRVPKMLADYHVGHSRNGMTIWWQIDEQGRVHTGKLMRYGPDGHRVKSKGYNSDWIHSTLARAGRTDIYDETKQEMKQCLFGLHLLGRYRSEDTNQTVCIVESEKTALLMAIAYGNNAKQVWMACGGLDLLSPERLEPLIKQHRRIVLYPDRDGIDAWRQKARELKYDRIAVDVRAVTEWWKPEDGPKADIADVVVRMINNPRRLSLEEARQRNPAFKAFEQTMNLTPSSNEEQQLHHGSHEDPAVDGNQA